MKYLKYPEYKDSGIEWIGEIPKHWTLLKLKYLSWCLDSKRIPVNAEERSYRGGQVEYWGANGVVGYIDNFLFNDELVLIGEDGAPFNEKFREVAFYINYPIWPNNHIHVLKAKERVLPNYLKHSLNSCDFTDFIEGSTRDKLTQSSLLEIPIALCNLKEQTQILSFLENEISKINALISKQQQLIELLKEKRQAIITHAVTKGLDPNVPMKDSGIKWIGEIPKHWKTKRLKNAAQLVTKKSNQDTKKVALENVESWSGRYIPTETEFEGEGIRFRAGDVLFGKLRPYLAKVYRAEFSGAAVGEFFVLRPNLDIESDFLSNLIVNREFINIVDGSTYGAKMPRADWGFMGYLLVAIPPKREQENICKAIEAKASRIDYLIQKQQRMIELLKEHKTSLISQAVTGKIDVRYLIQEVKEPA